jgi:hypothetical protein
MIQKNKSYFPFNKKLIIKYLLEIFFKNET